MADNTATISSARFWDERYQAGQTGWDLGQPAPAFAALLNRPNAPPPGRVAVLGCGRGHDARLFARHGFLVTGFDFAPSAIAEARVAAAEEGLAAEFVASDIFALPDRYAGAFDYVVEHTCFCAIDPARRPEYVSAVTRLLRPGGELIGVFFAHGRPGGPPFTTDEAEIRTLFYGPFALDHLAPCDHSIEQRQGQEIFARFRRR